MVLNGGCAAVDQERAMSINCFVLTFFLLFSMATQAQPLRVWLLAVNGAQRSVFVQEVSRFEALHPGFHVQLNVMENEAYKKLLFAALQQKDPPDVLFMFGGRDIEEAVQNHLVLSVETQWQAEWKNQLSPAASSAVAVNGLHYGLPLDYYAWGIYYNVAVFSAYGLRPPQTWKELLDTCFLLRQRQITPIALGSKDLWPVAAWFDYLDLRLNGLQFHQELLRGRQFWHDPRVTQVLALWQQLIRSNCFMQGHEMLGWRDVLPFLYHRQAAMMLMGNFWTAQIPTPMRADIALVPFPVVDAHVPLYEDSPTDVLVISAKTRQPDQARQFLEFFAQENVQDDIARSVGMLAAHRGGQIERDPFIEASRGILEHAQGVAQYFDRDAGVQFSAKALEVLQRFLLNQEDSAHVEDELELLSRQINRH